MYDPHTEIPGGDAEWLGKDDSVISGGAAQPEDSESTSIDQKYDAYHKTQGCLLPPTEKQRCQGLSFTLWIPCEEIGNLCGGNPCQPCMDFCSGNA